MPELRQTYTYCTVCKTRLDSQGNIKSCPQCGKQYYFNPLPNVTALITNQNDETLFVERTTEPYAAWWDLPGGFVNEGESLEQAVCRETKEEVGAELEGLRYITSTPTTYELRSITYSLILVFFAAHIKSEDGLGISDEASQYKFFSKQAIPWSKVAFEAQRKFLESYLV